MHTSDTLPLDVVIQKCKTNHVNEAKTKGQSRDPKTKTRTIHHEAEVKGQG